MHCSFIFCDRKVFEETFLYPFGYAFRFAQDKPYKVVLAIQHTYLGYRDHCIAKIQVEKHTPRNIMDVWSTVYNGCMEYSVCFQSERHVVNEINLSYVL